MERQMTFKDKPVVIPTQHVTRIVDHLYADTAFAVGSRDIREPDRGRRNARAFRIEWQGVESKGVYRRYVADNGCGMDADELKVTFQRLASRGSSSAPGTTTRASARSSRCFLWNHAGVVIVSWKRRRSEHDLDSSRRARSYLGLRTWENRRRPRQRRRAACRRRAGSRLRRDRPGLGSRGGRYRLPAARPELRAPLDPG